MVCWESNASWSDFKDTLDDHRSEDAAIGACKVMMRDYVPGSPCPTRGTCLKAWTTFNGNKDTNLKRRKKIRRQ